MSFAIGTRHDALCADGRARRALVANHADTFFTVPARVSVGGKTVTGFLWIDDGVTKFTANSWLKNAALLQWPTKKED